MEILEFPKPAPDDEIIQRLQSLLDLARQGTLTGLMYAAILEEESGDSCETFVLGRFRDEPLFAHGAVRLVGRTVDRIFEPVPLDEE